MYYMDQSLHFYTNILDFKKDGRWPSAGAPSFSGIYWGDIHIQLPTHSGDGVAGNVATIVVEDVDELYKKYISRGLNTGTKINRPFINVL
jgi:catechol 2,3-dioxygenase-like lactoylglutathione lyase family enzyme